eukprot:scaffold17792_cov146-Amphora_coffeaeformis.AAC.1
MADILRNIRHGGLIKQHVRLTSLDFPPGYPSDQVIGNIQPSTIRLVTAKANIMTRKGSTPMFHDRLELVGDGLGRTSRRRSRSSSTAVLTAGPTTIQYTPIRAIRRDIQNFRKENLLGDFGHAITVRVVKTSLDMDAENGGKTCQEHAFTRAGT